MQKKIVVHMYLKNGKAVTGFDGKELLEDGDVMSIAQHYSNNGADELLIFDLSDDDAVSSYAALKRLCLTAALKRAMSSAA